MTSGVKRTKEEIYEIVNSFGYELIHEYTNERGVRKVVIEDFDGYKFDVFLSHVREKRGMAKFDVRNPFTLENIENWILINNKSFSLCKNNIYEGHRKKLQLFCNKCKNNFYMSWSDILSGNGCGVCYGFQVVRKTSVGYMFPEIINAWSNNNKNSPYDFAPSSHKKVMWVCEKCGKDYILSIDNKVKSKRVYCKKCSFSNGEDRIHKFLSQKINLIENVDFFAQYRINECRYIYPLPFDFYILPINLLIEYNGEQHYKPVDFSHREEKSSTNKKFRNIIKRDKIKQKYCKNNGIPLLIIPYWEFENIEQILTETLFE